MNVRQRLDQLVAKKARVDGLVKDGLLTSNQKDRLRNASRLYGAGIWLMRKKLGRLKALRRKKDNIPSPEELKKIWADSSVFGDKVALKKQLSHAQMIALADRLVGWSMGDQMSPKQSANLLGIADGMRRLADEVGPSWSPPEPEKVSLLGFIGRWALEGSSSETSPRQG